MLCKIMAANYTSRFFKICDFYYIYIDLSFFHFGFGNKENCISQMANLKNPNQIMQIFVCEIRLVLERCDHPKVGWCVWFSAHNVFFSSNKVGYITSDTQYIVWLLSQVYL